MRLGLLFFWLISVFGWAQASYQKNYTKNRKQLISEGWLEKNQKTKFWKFYQENGQLEKEGHFCQGKACKYWYFYDAKGKKKSEGWFLDGKKTKWWKIYEDGKLVAKTQYEKDEKHGFSILYKKGKIYKAIKYERNKKLNEWSDLAQFKADNPELFR